MDAALGISFAHLTDVELIAEVKRLAARERSATVELLRSLIELDARRLYLGEGYASLFTFCTRELHLSEHAAYDRIEVARASARFPALLEALAVGALTLTSARLLAPHLTVENCATLLEASQGRSKRELELVLATHTGSLPAGSASASTISGHSTPVGANRFRIQFIAPQQTHEKLLRAQSLLRHAIPDGNLAGVVDRALTVLIEHLERRKLGIASRPRPTQSAAAKARRVPAGVRREVWKRDGGRCAFVGARGRCREQDFLEFHHVVPYADGGPSSLDNIQLRCRAHNAYEATLWFETGVPVDPA